MKMNNNELTRASEVAESQFSPRFVQTVKIGITQGVEKRGGTSGFDAKSIENFLMPELKAEKIAASLCILSAAQFAARFLTVNISDKWAGDFLRDAIVEHGTFAHDPRTHPPKPYQSGWLVISSGYITHPAIAWGLENLGLFSAVLEGFKSDGLLNLLEGDQQGIVFIVSVRTRDFFKLDNTPNDYADPKSTHAICLLGQVDEGNMLIFDPYPRKGVPLVREVSIKIIEGVLSGEGERGGKGIAVSKVPLDDRFQKYRSIFGLTNPNHRELPGNW